MAHTAASGRWAASVTAIAPLPVPTSATRSPARPRAQASAASIRCSVSGRGIKTAGETANSRSKKARLPVR